MDLASPVALARPAESSGPPPSPPPPRFTLRGASVLSRPQPTTSHFILDGRCTATRVSKAATHAEQDLICFFSEARSGAICGLGRQNHLDQKYVGARHSPAPLHALGIARDTAREQRRVCLKSQREGARSTPVKMRKPLQTGICPRTRQ